MMRQIIDKWLIQRTTIDATIEHSVLRICEGVNLNNRIPFNYVLKNLPNSRGYDDPARLLGIYWYNDQILKIVHFPCFSTSPHIPHYSRL